MNLSIRRQGPRPAPRDLFPDEFNLSVPWYILIYTKTQRPFKHHYNEQDNDNDQPTSTFVPDEDLPTICSDHMSYNEQGTHDYLNDYSPLQHPPTEDTYDTESATRCRKIQDYRPRDQDYPTNLHTGSNQLDINSNHPTIALTFECNSHENSMISIDPIIEQSHTFPTYPQTVSTNVDINSIHLVPGLHPGLHNHKTIMTPLECVTEEAHNPPIYLHTVFNLAEINYTHLAPDQTFELQSHENMTSLEPVIKRPRTPPIIIYGGNNKKQRTNSNVLDLIIGGEEDYKHTEQGEWQHLVNSTHHLETNQQMDISYSTDTNYSSDQPSHHAKIPNPTWLTSQHHLGYLDHTSIPKPKWNIEATYSMTQHPAIDQTVQFDKFNSHKKYNNDLVYNDNHCGSHKKIDSTQDTICTEDIEQDNTERTVHYTKKSDNSANIDEEVYCNKGMNQDYNTVHYIEKCDTQTHKTKRRGKQQKTQCQRRSQNQNQIAKQI